jgi:predicted AlkP superfamily pyrophosphatase or phosphodiesterase
MTHPRTRFFILILAAFFLASCLPASLEPTPALTATPPPTSTFTPFPPTETPTLTATPAPLVRRVLILSIDGFRPDAIDAAPMPNLQALMETGAYSLTAQTIYPSSTLPAHSSMLTGLCPSKHEVDWNDYLPDKGYANGTDLFDLAHAAGLFTMMVVGKEKLRQITEPESTDEFIYINDRGLVIAQQIVDNFPSNFRVLFVHFPTPDAMGHEYGWMSSEYLSVLRQDDQALARLLAKLDETGLRDETLVIVTADHGGHKQMHGTNLPEDMTIPWIVSGPMVVPAELSVPINTTDTAATAAWALELDRPSDWDGIPVYEAFGQVSSTSRPAPRCP